MNSAKTQIERKFSWSTSPIISAMQILTLQNLWQIDVYYKSQHARAMMLLKAGRLWQHVWL